MGVKKNTLFLSYIARKKVQFSTTSNQLTITGKTNDVEGYVFCFQKQQWVYRFILKPTARRNISKR
jgi:hypothetical protein